MSLRHLVLARWRDGDRIGLLLAAAFLWLAVPLGILLIATVPPGQAPDEGVHAARLASLVSGQFVGHRGRAESLFGTQVMAGVDADLGIVGATAFLRDSGQRIVTLDQMAAARIMPWYGTDVFLGIGMTSSYFPTFYLPAAAVVAGSRALGIKPLPAVMAARALNFLLYAAGAIAALLLAQRGQLLIFGALAAPLPLCLGASLNQDGLMLAAAALAAALLSRRVAESRLDGNLILGAVLLAAIALAKAPYAALCCLLLFPLPPLRQWRVLAARVAIALGTVLPALAWSGYVAANVMGGVPFAPYQPGPLWPGPRPFEVFGADPTLQAQVMAAHPVQLLAMALETVFPPWRMLPDMFGGIGFLDIVLPRTLYLLGGIAACFALLGDMSVRGPARPVALVEFLITALAAIAAAIGVCLSLYLTWTPVGAAFIHGMTGRYLLPLLPALAITLPRLPMPRGAVLRIACCVPLVLALAACLALLPATIVTAHYLR